MIINMLKFNSKLPVYCNCIFMQTHASSRCAIIIYGVNLLYIKTSFQTRKHSGDISIVITA